MNPYKKLFEAAMDALDQVASTPAGQAQRPVVKQLREASLRLENPVELPSFVKPSQHVSHDQKRGRW